MTELDEAIAREEFPTLLDRVVDDKEQVVLTRHGKPVAVLVPAEDWGPLVPQEEHRPDPEPLRRLDALIAQAGARRVEDLPEKRPNPEWQRRFEDVVAKLQNHIPVDMTVEEIEAEARAAQAEVRAERRARGR